MDSDMRARRKRSGWLPYLFAIFATALSMALIVAYTFTTFYDNAKISVRRQAQLSVVDKSEAFAMYMDRARIALDIVSAAAEGIIAEGYDYGRLGDLLHRQSLIINERIESEFTGAYACVNGIYIDGKEWVLSGLCISDRRKTLDGVYLEEHYMKTDWVDLAVNVNTQHELALSRAYFE